MSVSAAFGFGSGGTTARHGNVSESRLVGETVRPTNNGGAKMIVAVKNRPTTASTSLRRSSRLPVSPRSRAGRPPGGTQRGLEPGQAPIDPGQGIPGRCRHRRGQVAALEQGDEHVGDLLGRALAARPV